MKQVIATPLEAINLRVHVAALVVSGAAMIIGYDASFIGTTVVLPEFRREFGFNDMDTNKVSDITANIISLFHVGAFFGSYLVYPIAIYWGRIVGFKLAGFLIIVGSVIQLISNSDIGVSAILAGRVISGVGIGAVSNLAPMYVTEVSPAIIRGRLVAMYEIAWQTGGIFGFFINYGTEKNITGNAQWRIPIAVQLIPAGVFFIGVFFIVESPRWCFINNKKERAIKSLCYLRKMPEDSKFIKQEVEMMEREALERRRALSSEFFGPFKLLFGNKTNRYKLMLSLCLFIFQNTSGINAIIYYSVAILKTIGIKSIEAGLLSTGVFGLLKGCSCFVWAFLIIDKFGRKPPVIIGGTICFLTLIYLGVYIKVADPANTLNGHSTAGSRSALAFFYIWTISFAVSWSGFPWVYMTEIFETKVRNLSQCFNASSNWLWAFVFARYAQRMIDAMNYGIFLFFGLMLFCSTIIFSLVYPETKHIPIDDIDLLFEKGVKPWKAHKRAVEIIASREYNFHEVEPMPDKSAAYEERESLESAGSSSRLV